ASIVKKWSVKCTHALLDENVSLNVDKGTDIANITRKRSKPDKLEHGNGYSAQEPGIF
ncbi:hypothetical protein Tco_1306117, partial [Tanacetum coccineum]